MPFERHRAAYWGELKSIQSRPVVAYSAAIGFVLLAALFRRVLNETLVAGTPFITFFAAVIAATYIGGLGAGVLAALLSAGVAWLIFLPPAWAFALEVQQIASLVLFLAMSAINIALVVALTRALARAEGGARRTRKMLEHLPVGIVVADANGQIALANRLAQRQFEYEESELVGKPIDKKKGLVEPTRISGSAFCLEDRGLVGERGQIVAACDQETLGLPRRQVGIRGQYRHSFRGAPRLRQLLEQFPDKRPVCHCITTPWRINGETPSTVPRTE